MGAHENGKVTTYIFVNQLGNLILDMQMSAGQGYTDAIFMGAYFSSPVFYLDSLIQMWAPP